MSTRIGCGGQGRGIFCAPAMNVFVRHTHAHTCTHTHTHIHTHTHSHSHSHTHTQCALFFRSGCWTTTTSCPSTAQPSLASTHFSLCEPLPPAHPIPKAQQPKPMCTRAFSMPILTRTMYPSLLTPRTVLWPRTASQRWSFFSRRRCSCFNHCECPVLKKGEQRQPCMCMCDGEKSGLLA